MNNNCQSENKLQVSWYRVVSWFTISLICLLFWTWIGYEIGRDVGWI